MVQDICGAKHVQEAMTKKYHDDKQGRDGLQPCRANDHPKQRYRQAKKNRMGEGPVVNPDGKAQPPNQNKVEIWKDGQKPQEGPGQRVTRTGQSESYSGMGNGKSHDGLVFAFQDSKFQVEDYKFRGPPKPRHGIGGNSRVEMSIRTLPSPTPVVKVHRLPLTETLHGREQIKGCHCGREQ